MLSHPFRFSSQVSYELRMDLCTTFTAQLVIIQVITLMFGEEWKLGSSLLRSFVGLPLSLLHRGLSLLHRTVSLSSSPTARCQVLSDRKQQGKMAWNNFRTYIRKKYILLKSILIHKLSRVRITNNEFPERRTELGHWSCYVQQWEQLFCINPLVLLKYIAYLHNRLCPCE
jgi:hypothetical protein